MTTLKQAILRAYQACRDLVSRAGKGGATAH